MFIRHPMYPPTRRSSDVIKLTEYHPGLKIYSQSCAKSPSLRLVPAALLIFPFFTVLHIPGYSCSVHQRGGPPFCPHLKNSL